MNRIRNNIIYISFLVSSMLLAQQDVIERNFIPSGKLDGMVENGDQNLSLIQLNLSNDSLYQIIDDNFPNLELINGPASYHRIISSSYLNQIQELLDSQNVIVLNDEYSPPDDSRLYWTETKQGNNTHGTYSSDEAVEYTCSCIDDQSDNCVKLGYDESWYNPFDYYGEAWWAFDPPYYDYIQEIRVTVRGAQCDDLPLWSETYMGLKDDNDNWSNDYELSINYTDNTFIVPFTFNQGILMPIIGSEDNYVIDFVRFDFFYSCIESESAISLIAEDQQDCSSVEINWELEPGSQTDLIRVYRDSNLIFETDSLGETSLVDYSAEDNIQHEYCIETLNGCSNSEWVCDFGSLRNIPNSVSNVYAQNGEEFDQVQVTWSGVDYIDGYRIHRDGAWISLVYPHQDLEYIDIYAEPGIIYNYCIESYNDCGNSQWVCDTGFSGSYLGDSNFDGSIDVLDVVTLVNFILSIDTPNENQLFWLDMNQDSFLNVQDVVLIVNIILD